MQGLLKSRSAGSQFLIFISISLVSLFVVGLLGTQLLAIITGKGLLEVSDPSKWDYTKPGLSFIIRGTQIVQFISFFCIPVFLCTWLFSTNGKKYLGLKAPSETGYFFMGIGLMVISIPLVQLLGEWNRNVQFPSGIAQWMQDKEKEAAKITKILLSAHTIKDLILNIICIAALAAVGEELLFRGMAQRLLIKMFKSPWAGIIVSAILFSAIHLQFYGFVPRLVLGIFLGAMYWYSGSLWVAILGHFIYDALLIVLAYFYPSMLNDEPTTKISSLALGGAISAALVATSFVWMKKRSKVTYEEMYADDAVPNKDHPF